MFLLLLCVPVLLTVRVRSQSCPAAYARFSQTHSYCMPPNPQCHIVKSGVPQQEMEEILREHNNYRSKVATGQETEAGGLPEASNMLQMVWDDELAAVAQSWANQCQFEHDCNECRQVEAFGVGQNIAFRSLPCSTNCDVTAVSKPDWTTMIKLFYDEVSHFDKNVIKKYQFGYNYGHFSQVTWAESWRIGCGYVVYTKGNNYEQFYVCNYGPNGNGQTSLYKEGKPCSGCPINSCCGGTRPEGDVSYPGLCNLKPTSSPVYKNTEDTLLDCDVDESTDCEASMSEKWMKKSTVAGNYFTITLKGGEKGTLDMAKPFTPHGPTCVRIMFRKGPSVDGNPDLSELVLHVKTTEYPIDMPLQVTISYFVPMSIDLDLNSETKVGVTFSVSNGAGDHILDIKRITAFDGKCDSREMD